MENQLNPAGQMEESLEIFDAANEVNVEQNNNTIILALGDQKPLKVKKQKKIAKKSKMIQKRSNLQSTEIQLEGASEHSERSYKSQKTTQQR